MGLFRRTKNTNKPLIRQIIDLVPRWMLAHCADRHKSDKGCSKYKTYDQFVALTFGQPNKCLTLSDISTGIGISETFISDLGLTQSPARSTMSDGNKNRGYQVFETLYYKLLSHYGRVLSEHGHGRIIEEIRGKTIKLIDSTTIALCLSMFDRAKFRTAKGGIKIHTCWDDAMMIPDMVNITEAKLHDSKVLAQLVFSKGTVIVEDRAYFGFSLMLQRSAAENWPWLPPMDLKRPSEVPLIFLRNRTTVLCKSCPAKFWFLNRSVEYMAQIGPPQIEEIPFNKLESGFIKWHVTVFKNS